RSWSTSSGSSCARAAERMTAGRMRPERRRAPPRGLALSRAIPPRMGGDAADMTAHGNHRRVLHFAVTGVLLGGAVGCASNEPAKNDKAEQKHKVETTTKQPRHW